MIVSARTARSLGLRSCIFVAPMNAACAQFVALLQATMQPNQQVIEAASAQLAQLELQPGFAVVLCTILGARDLDESTRQAAGLHLKRYCQHHWDDADDEFVEPLVCEADRVQLRQLLPPILLDPSSKLRTAAAMVIGRMAHDDYPDHWPTLLDTLMSYICSNDAIAVQGAIRALVMFAEDIQEHQLPVVSEHLFPVLLRVLQATDVFTPRVRMRAITVYRICISSLFERVEDAAITKRIVSQTLPTWMELFSRILSDHSVDELGMGFGVRLEAIKTINTLVKDSPKALSKYLPQLMKQTWDLLSAVIPHFVTRIVNADDAESVSALDDEGETIGVESFLDQCLDMFGNIAQSTNSTVRSLLESPAVLTELVTMSLTLMQLAVAQCLTWEDDPNEFVAAEDDCENSYTVRSSGKFLILRLIESFDNAAVEAISVAAASMLNQAQSGTHAWKLRESAVLAVGLVASELPEVSKQMEKRAKRNKKKGDASSESVALNVPSFIANVLLPDMDPARAANALVRARAIWCVCEFAELMPEEYQAFVLQGVMLGFGSEQPLPVRLSSARGFGALVSSFPSDLTSAALLPALRSLCELLAVAEEATLHMVLDTLTVSLEKLDESNAAEVESVVTPLLLRAWSAHSDDMLVSECVTDVFRVLSRITACVAGLQTHAIPTLLQVLNAPQAQAGVLQTALSILQLVLQASSQLPDQFVSSVLPLVVQRAVASEDHTVMQEATTTVVAFIERATQQLRSLGHIPLLFRLVSQLLDPKQTEEGASNVGLLLTRLLVHYSDMFDESTLMSVLNAAMIRLDAANNPHLIRGLLMLFARFINTNGAENAMMSLSRLSAIPVAQVSADQATVTIAVPQPHVPAELPGPLALLVKWARNHGDLEVMSPYYTKVSVHALSHLLRCAALQESLTNILVPGYAIVDTKSSKPATRSSGRTAVKYQFIPLGAKITGLLLNSCIQASRARGAFDMDDDDDEEELDDDDEDRPSPFVDADEYAARGNLLSDRLDFDFGDEDEVEEDDVDPTDPICALEISTFVPASLRAVGAALQHWSSSLSANDQESLHKVLA